MSYTNSPMVSYTKLSPNHSGQRTHSIDRITPHCVVGQCSVETLGRIFTPTSKQASSNYGIGLDGRVGMYVEEKNRSWCSSSNANDQRAVTIECASDSTEPYAFKDVVYQTLIKLCVDICQRNGKTKLLWLGDKDKTPELRPQGRRNDPDRPPLVCQQELPRQLDVCPHGRPCREGHCGAGNCGRAGEAHRPYHSPAPSRRATSCASCPARPTTAARPSRTG